MDLKIKDNSKLKFGPITQLEYIESTGTQWIDTGIEAAVTDNFYIEYQFTTSGIDERSCFGVHGAAQAGMICRNGWWWGGNRHYDYVQGITKHTLSKENTTWSLDGVVLQYNVNSGAIANNNWCLFTAPSGTDYTSYASAVKIYNFKLYGGDRLIVNFIPVKDLEGVVCLYDTVSQTFFYNQGTGDFIAGPEVIRQGLPKNIYLKTTTLYHKNTPNVNGLQILNGIFNIQETAEDIVLNRIRIDIGNVNGSITELLQYAGMTGFNDEGEEQAKPRLVGTWTINDWYTQAQLAQAQAAFDGLTIIEDLNYKIDFSQLAVQVLDDTQPNYNPAVAIILQGQHLGVTFSTAPISGQTGRWILTKTQAAEITSTLDWFKSKTNVTDTNGIVTSDTTATYQFTDFDVFQYFSGVTVGCALQGSSGVKYITLPPNFTALHGGDWWEIRFIRVTLNNIAINLGTDWSVAYHATIQNLIYKSIEQASKFKLVESGDRAISVNNVYVNDTLLTELTIDDSITDIGYTKVLGTSLTKIKLHNNITKANISNTGVSTVGLAGSGADIELPTSVITFGPSKSLTSLELPSSITNLSEQCFYNKSVGPQDILTIPSGVTVIPSYCFSGMTGIKIIELQGNVTKFGELAFYTGSGYVHLCGTTIPTIVYPEYYSRKTYVGLGQSQAEDEALLATFRADSTWSSKNLDTWYNYLHPQS